MELAQWITELSTNLAVEKLTYMAEGRIEDFSKTRSSFQTFMESLRDLDKDRCHHLYDLEMAHC